MVDLSKFYTLYFLNNSRFACSMFNRNSNKSLLFFNGKSNQIHMKIYRTVKKIILGCFSEERKNNRKNERPLWMLPDNGWILQQWLMLTPNK